jgi:hypothetical protein
MNARPLIALACLLAACWQASALAQAERSPIPAAAAAAGFRLHTFATNATFSASTVDMDRTYAPGFQWYFPNYFGTHQPSSSTSFNPDGSVTTSGQRMFSNGNLATMGQISTPPYFVGTAFGGGGYFEAEFRFDPSAVDNRNDGWPAFWNQTLESVLVLPGYQWPGQAPGYTHNVELDTFEFYGDHPFSYGASVHDWWGVHNVTCKNHCGYVSSPLWNTKIVPLGTDWRKYHRVAALWIPAAKGADGSISFFFDDRQMGPAIRFSKFTNQPPPPGPSASWTFGAIDQLHLIPIFGAGLKAPITVRSVNVWQKSAAANLTGATS